MTTRASAALRDVAERLTAPVGSITRVRTSEPVVVLTYDDGPHPVGTPAVLEALADAGAGATFFVLLTAVRRHPEVLREVVAAGHEVALHGEDHRAFTDLPRGSVRACLAAARAELEDRTGSRVRWVRPPYGRQTPGTWDAARRAGLTPVMWGPTTWDSRHVGQEERVAHVRGALRPGAILLAHDAFAGPSDAADDGPEPDVDRGDLARRVLGLLEEQGLRGVGLGEALTGGRPHRRAWFGR